ncbi:MAG: HAD-IIIA family hydrolase [Candidatus Azambacteria bacterium]|nr:HAD-IIIA family hydrolase [Candidatus Azambacteria bacterium]
MKTVIIAGGKGTRLAPLTKKIPKSLVKIGGKPLIEHQIILLKKYGIREIWILLGYLGDPIREYLQNGEKWHVNIHYLQEDRPLGTAGAVKTLENKIKGDFLVISGDVMLDFDVKRFIGWHKGIASIVVHPNDHPIDSDLVETDKTGRILSLLKRPHPPGLIFHNLSIASAYIFSPKIFKYIQKNKKTDIEKDILPLILKSKEKMYAYNTPEYIKDMGTPDRLAKVREDYLAGKTKELNLENKRRAVFLDRDGVINQEVDQLSKKEQLKIYDFAVQAIKRINESDYLTVLITNQPMIAKGFMTEEDLNEIHKKLETELGLRGAKIDAIYHCPHHPEKGFSGEIPSLKIKCKCRKPEIGLFLKARKDFNIDLKKSYFIGDKTSDILTGSRAGGKTILVKTGYGGKDKLFSAKPDFIAKNIFEAVKIIIPRKNYEN